MKTELSQLQKIEQVEVPEMLFEKIQLKIEYRERISRIHTKLFLAAAVLVFIVNLSIVGQHMFQNTSNSESEPYSYSTLNYSLYE